MMIACLKREESIIGNAKGWEYVYEKMREQNAKF